MNTINVESTRTLQRLSEAAEWKLLAMLLSCPQGDWPSQVAMLAEETRDVHLQQAARLMTKEATEGLYHTTFGPGGPAAPREVSHREYVTPSASLAELSSYYQAFAFHPATDEPPDHVGVECDFMAYLRVKEAYGLARGDQEQAAAAAEAAQGFVTNHLTHIAQPLLASLVNSGIEYLRLAAEALVQRVGPAPNADLSPSARLELLTADMLDCCGLNDDEPPTGPSGIA